MVLVRELLSARRGELLDVGRVGIVTVLYGALVDNAHEVGDVPAAPDGTQLGANRRLERVHGRRRDLHDDGGDEVLLRLGVVVREDELALGAVDSAVRLIDNVARREHVRRHRIVVDAPDDVRSGGARSARVRRRVARRDDRRIAKEPDEASRQVDERGAVALVAARREKTVGTHRGRGREGVEALDRRAVSQHKRNLHRTRTGDEEHLVQVRRTADDLDVAIGTRLRSADRGERRIPVDLARLAREAGEKLAHLRVRRLLGDHAPDRPRRKRPGSCRRGCAR